MMTDGRDRRASRAGNGAKTKSTRKMAREGYVDIKKTMDWWPASGYVGR